MVRSYRGVNRICPVAEWKVAVANRIYFHAVTKRNVAFQVAGEETKRFQGISRNRRKEPRERYRV